MADYIDREKAIEQTVACFTDPLIMGTIVDALEDVPKADVVERKIHIPQLNYCPFCGGKEYLPEYVVEVGRVSSLGITCLGCQARISIEPCFGRDACDIWNHRPNEAIKTEVLNEQVQC